ncbi:MAG: sugar nucleotide-binding protein [Chitinispirillaceae bacterium]
MTGVTSIHGWPIFDWLNTLMGSDRLYAIRSPKMRIPRGENVLPVCITDKDTLKEIKKRFHPTHVLHCAGVCDLDVCEERPAWARLMNTEGARVIADVFGEVCHVTYFSSDLIFSGRGVPQKGYCEECVPDPLTVAGKTMVGAEREISRCPRFCIVRLGLPIGESVTGDKGAVGFIRRRFERSLPVTLFRDELRSCIKCDDITAAAVRILQLEPEGLLHCGGPVKRSLHRLGEYVLRRGGFDPFLLKGILRREEKAGPPRMGDVSLNSAKAEEMLGIKFSIGF